MRIARSVSPRRLPPARVTVSVARPAHAAPERKTPDASTAYGQLVLAGEKLSALIRRMQGRGAKQQSRLARQINRLAWHCLMAAALETKDLVDQSCLEQAVTEVLPPELS